MKSKYLFALAITAVFLTVSLILTVSVAPVLAPSYTVTVIIKDPSHTHGAVWLYQPSGARSHVYLAPNDPNPPCSPFPECYPDLQTQVDADTWSISVALTTDISGVPWSISEPITVAVYDLVGFPESSHFNRYCCYFLQSEFTGTFVVCYDPNVLDGGLCPAVTTMVDSTSSTTVVSATSSSTFSTSRTSTTTTIVNPVSVAGTVWTTKTVAGSPAGTTTTTLTSVSTTSTVVSSVSQESSSSTSTETQTSVSLSDSSTIETSTETSFSTTTVTFDSAVEYVTEIDTIHAYLLMIYDEFHTIVDHVGVFLTDVFQQTETPLGEQVNQVIVTQTSAGSNFLAKATDGTELNVRVIVDSNFWRPRTTPFTMTSTGRHTFSAPQTVLSGGVKYTFLRWEDEAATVVSTSRSFTVTLQSAKTFTAVYAKPTSTVTYTLTVKVNSGWFRPVAGATVTLDGVQVGTTDSYGKLVIQGVSAGSHQLVISKAGYKDYMATINITSNKTVTATLAKI